MEARLMSVLTALCDLASLMRPITVVGFFLPLYIAMNSDSVRGHFNVQHQEALLFSCTAVRYAAMMLH